MKKQKCKLVLRYQIEDLLTELRKVVNAMPPATGSIADSEQPIVVSIRPRNYKDITSTLKCEWLQSPQWGFEMTFMIYSFDQNPLYGIMGLLPDDPNQLIIQDKPDVFAFDDYDGFDTKLLEEFVGFDFDDNLAQYRIKITYEPYN
jgi:hypothetical protein